MSACERCGREKAEPGQDLADDDKRCHNGMPWLGGANDSDCMRLAYERVTRERDEARLLLLTTWVRGHAIGSYSDAQAAAIDAMLDPIVAVTTKAERDAALDARKAKEAPHGCVKKRKAKVQPVSTVEYWPDGHRQFICTSSKHPGDDRPAAVFMCRVCCRARCEACKAITITRPTEGCVHPTRRAAVAALIRAAKESR